MDWHQTLMKLWPVVASAIVPAALIDLLAHF